MANKPQADDLMAQAPAVEKEEPTTNQAPPPEYKFSMYEYGSEYPDPLDPRRWMHAKDAEDLYKIYEFNWVRWDKLHRIGDFYFRFVTKKEFESKFKPLVWNIDGLIVAGELCNGKPELTMIVRPIEAKKAQQDALRKVSLEKTNPELNPDVVGVEKAIKDSVREYGGKVENTSKKFVTTESWGGLKTKAG